VGTAALGYPARCSPALFLSYYLRTRFVIMMAACATKSGFLWNATKGHRLAPWRSPYLLLAHRDLHRREDDPIGFVEFWEFMWRERGDLWRFLKVDSREWSGMSIPNRRALDLSHRNPGSLTNHVGDTARRKSPVDQRSNSGILVRRSGQPVVLVLLYFSREHGGGRGWMFPVINGLALAGLEIIALRKMRESSYALGVLIAVSLTFLLNAACGVGPSIGKRIRASESDNE